MSARRLLRQGAAFVRLDALEEFAYPLSTFFRYSRVVMVIVVQYFVARLVGVTDSVGGDYFTFAAIGLAMAAALDRSLGDFGGRLQAVQNNGTLETLLMEPFPWTLVPVAMSVWHMLAAAISAVLALAVAVALGADMVLSGAPALLAVLVLSIGAGATVGIASGSLLLLTKRSSPILTLYGLVATLLGGAVFPLTLLPDWLAWAPWFIPHAYAIDAARGVLMPTAPAASRSLGVALLGLAIINVVLLPIAIWAFNRSLSVARRRGELGAY